MITQVPEWHPEYTTFSPHRVSGWLIHHASGPILVDAGMGTGAEIIDSWYRPQRVPLARALASAGVDPNDIAAIVLTHLHWDHCGGQRELAAPVYVQVDELDAGRAPNYTIEAWARIESARLRPVDGDVEIADGVRLIATPGHTPGHQSVVVEDGSSRVVLAGQCAFTADELSSGQPASTNLHDISWTQVATESLQRIHKLAPVEAQLSHDERVVHLACQD